MFLVMSIVGFHYIIKPFKFWWIPYDWPIGLIIASVVNIFLKCSLYTGLLAVLEFSYLQFLLLTLLKNLNISRYGFFEQNGVRFTVLAALDLYLNFINLLLYVLRIFRERKIDYTKGRATAKADKISIIYSEPLL